MLIFTADMKQLTIKITDTNRQPLIEVYKQLEIDLIRDLSDVRNALAELTGDKTYTSKGLDGYNKEWTWIQKTRFIITKNNKPLSTTEIANEIINKYEPEKRDDRKQVVSAISSVISTNQEHEEGQFWRMDGERQGEYKYLLFEWVAGSESAKPPKPPTRSDQSGSSTTAIDDLPF